MEIPYIVNPRKDTGLTNSKIAIWLFLASEVMLFGGLFSSYIFLRIFADYPWPERALPVLPGLLNTFILIASSVTVVFAWAALKLRKWGMFVGNMAFTLICAIVFMVFKANEYSAKFHHHAVQYNDFAILEGHTHGGNHYEIKATSVNVSLGSFHANYINSILEDAEEGKNVPTLAAPYKITEFEGDGYSEKLLFKAGSALSVDMLKEAKIAYIEARTFNEKLRTKLLRDAWHILRDGSDDPRYRDVKEQFADLEDWDSKVKDRIGSLHGELIKEAEANHLFMIENGNMGFVTDGAVLQFETSWGKMTGKKKGDDSTVSLLDQTVVKGEAGNSDLELTVDAIDFRHLVMKAENKGVDGDALIEKSIVLDNDEIKKIWETHKVWREFFRADLAEEYGDDKNGEPKRVPTALDLYRVTWKQMVSYHKLDYNITADNWKMVTGGEGTGEFADKERVYPTMIDGFSGANHKRDDFKAAFVHQHVHRDEIRFDSVFSPKMNNYYAIYFTVTGLHGLHVIGGAIVLGYYLFFGRKMYLANPEWLANRVEVGGLFWHFVDLVWIFAFPIFYLM